MRLPASVENDSVRLEAKAFRKGRTVQSLLFKVLLVSVAVLAPTVGAQTPALRLANVIAFEGVKGEFDHLAIDLARNRLYLAAEDQKTVEVLDLATSKHIASIRLFARPHGLVFLPGSSTLIVADGGDGTAKFVDVDGPKVSNSVKTALRADSVAYDAGARTVFVANGGVVAKMDYSLLTAISANQARSLGELRIDSKILEALAVEKSGTRLFLNLMDKNQVDVIDKTKRELLTSWPLSDAEQPSAMALDEAQQRLFVGCRKPARLLVLDTTSGKTVASLPSIGHADDAFYDESRKRIYVSGGEGAVSIYQQRGPDEYEQLPNVATGAGAKTSLFVPELKKLFVAVPAGSDGRSQVMIFDTNL
jgi:DNA-binding beta-propeller fold protein YncE